MTNTYATTDRTHHGAYESNGLVDPDAYFAVDRSHISHLADPDLAQITRLRLISDPGFPMWDASYCHGRLTDGTEVKVHLPVQQFRKGAVSRGIVDMARQAGRYAKGLGTLDAVSTCQ